MRKASRIPLFASWIEYMQAWFDRRAADMIAMRTSFESLKVRDDPEAMFQQGWMMCDVGEYDKGLEDLQRAITHGYYPATTMVERRQFDALRDSPAFQDLLVRAQAGRTRALEAFRQAGGIRLLACNC